MRRLAALVLVTPLALGGCVALGYVITGFGVGSTAVGIGQRNQAQDTAEETLEEMRGLRDDLRRSGLVKSAPATTAISEAARDRQVEIAERPRGRSVWERIKRMAP